MTTNPDEINENGFCQYFHKEHLEAQFKDKVSINPHFYITYGPPASGKATIMETILETRNKTMQDVVQVNVDDIVKEFSPYKEAAQMLIKAPKESRQKLYRDYRCALADNASDTLLDKALLRRYDIVWETNGRNIAWTVRELVRIRKMGYDISLVYPYVKRGELIKRAHKREGQENAPDNDIIEAAELAQMHLPKLIQYVDKVCIYDNNGERGKPKLLLEISHEYLGTNFSPDRHNNNNGKKRKYKEDTESTFTGHVYVIECSLNCNETMAIMAREDGQEKHLIEMLHHFCCP